MAGLAQLLVFRNLDGWVKEAAPARHGLVILMINQWWFNNTLVSRLFRIRPLSFQFHRSMFCNLHLEGMFFITIGFERSLRRTQDRGQWCLNPWETLSTNPEFSSLIPRSFSKCFGQFFVGHHYRLKLYESLTFSSSSLFSFWSSFLFSVWGCQ